jgi:hypothetical protein
MATTITPATATITVKVAVTLGDQDRGFEHSFTIASVTEAYNRIIAVPTSEMEILAFVASTPGGAADTALNEADVRLIAITNLDDTNFVQLTIASENSNECAHKLEAGHVMFIPTSAEGVVNVHDASASALTVSFDDITSITALADTGECDLLVFALGV